MEENLERWASGAGEIGDMNGFDWDKREESPEKEEQKKIKQDWEEEKQGREEESQYENERQKKHSVHVLKSP